MANAQDRLRAIARAEGGAFIIAPDSADPWPADIWERVDLRAVEGCIAAQDHELSHASPQDLREGTSSSGIYFTPSQRDLLTQIGKTSVDFPFRAT